MKQLPHPFLYKPQMGCFGEEVWGWTIEGGCFTFYKLLPFLDCGVYFTMTDLVYTVKVSEYYGFKSASLNIKCLIITPITLLDEGQI